MTERSRAQPRHHPSAEDLLEYASGASAEWHALMVACHLTFCARCRDEVALLDDVGGALLELSQDGADAEQPRDGDWIGRAVASATGAMDSTTTAGFQPAPPSLPASLAGVAPRPLAGYLAEPDGRFRRLAPGIKHVPLRELHGVQLRLVELGAGFVIPPHGHAGLEWLLVLDGDIGDSHTGERYRRGDVCCSDTDKEHSQDVASNEPCIALVANLGPLVPKTLLGRVLSKIVKI